MGRPLRSQQKRNAEENYLNNLYCYFGGEDFLIDQEIIKLRANLSKTAKIEVELERLSGKNLTWEQLTGLTLGGGLFSSLRLVVIEQFDACDLEDREADFERLISQLHGAGIPLPT